MGRQRVGRIAVALACLAWVGCSTYRVQPIQPYTPGERIGEHVRLHRTDGSTVVLELEDETTAHFVGAETSVPKSDVELVEVRAFSFGRTAFVTLGAFGIGVTVATLIAFKNISL